MIGDETDAAILRYLYHHGPRDVQAIRRAGVTTLSSSAVRRRLKRLAYHRLAAWDGRLWGLTDVARFVYDVAAGDHESH